MRDKPPSLAHDQANKRRDSETMETGARRGLWRVVGLIFVASCLTYMDRQMFGLLKPMMQAERAPFTKGTSSPDWVTASSAAAAANQEYRSA